MSTLKSKTAAQLAADAELKAIAIELAALDEQLFALKQHVDAHPDDWQPVSDLRAVASGLENTRALLPVPPKDEAS